MAVKLNVGGKIFCTTETTLTSRGPNMLSAMIQHANPAKMVDGALFIDRDPRAFRWILNYLRGSRVFPPKDSTDLKLMREEAEYYAMDDLRARIQNVMRHAVSPTFKKGNGILLRDQKCTVVDVLDDGYLITCKGQRYRIDAAETLEPATLEVGDTVMVWKSTKLRVPGLCTGVDGKYCTVQLNNEAEQKCPLSAICF